jgi:hypothetical protein
MNTINKCLILILILTACTSLAIGQKKSTKSKSLKKQRVTEVISPEEGQWKEIISKEGNFKIKFPSAPENFVGNNSNAENGKYHEFKVSTKFLKYSASYADSNLAGGLNSEQLRSFYDVFQTKIAESDNRIILEATDLQTSGVLGREVKYKKSNLIIVDRYILDDRRFYQLLTTTFEEYDKGENIRNFRKRFLESFQFVNK